MTSIALPVPHAPYSGSLSRALTDLVAPSWSGATSASTSFSLDLSRMETHSALVEIEQEAREPDWDGYGASPVYPETVALARSLLSMLPSSLPAPEVSASPLGEVSFHWRSGPGRVVSVAVSATGRLTFACLNGGDRLYGAENLSDELPQAIAIALRRIVA